MHVLVKLIAFHGASILPLQRNALHTTRHMLANAVLSGSTFERIVPSSMERYHALRRGALPSRSRRGTDSRWGNS